MKIFTRVFALSILIVFIAMSIVAGVSCISHVNNLQTIDVSVSEENEEPMKVPVDSSSETEAAEGETAEISNSPESMPTKPSVSEAAENIISGMYGNGEERSAALVELGFTEEEIAEIQSIVDTTLSNQAEEESVTTAVSDTNALEGYPHIDVASIIWNRVKQEGYSNEVCAGILGNIQAECGFEYQIEGYGCWGMCQWAGPRLDNLRNNYGTDLDSQITFMLMELKDFSGIKECTSVYDATSYFCFNFERPGIPAIELRSTYAEDWYARAMSLPYIFNITS